MAIILRLTDGTTTINLTGGTDGITLDGYAPAEPQLSVVEFEPATVMDGGEASAITRRNITETCPVTITGATQADVQAALNGVQAMFMRAIEFQNRRGGSRVYVELSPDGETVYRSEILYGRIELGERPLTWLTKGPALGAGLIWRRRYFWEGDEVALVIANDHGVADDGVTVYNHLDSAHENWVEIAGAGVTGVLPAPAKISLVNSYGTGVLGKVLIGHNVYADPVNLAPMLEWELADSTLGSPAGDADCSGGSYMAVDLAASREKLLGWTLAAAALTPFAGRFFRLWLRCRSAPLAGTYLQPKALLGLGSDIVSAEGQETLLDENELLQDLGVLQIPPYLMGESEALYPIVVALYGRREGGGAIDGDCVLAMPLDGYRELRPRGYGLEPMATLVDDGIEARVFETTDDPYTGLPGWSGFYYGLGAPILLVPGVDQRLYFLMANTEGGSEIERTASVTVRYRPRRLTV